MTESLLTFVFRKKKKKVLLQLVRMKKKYWGQMELISEYKHIYVIQKLELHEKIYSGGSCVLSYLVNLVLTSEARFPYIFFLFFFNFYLFMIVTERERERERERQRHRQRAVSYTHLTLPTTGS